jgi:hypothetical protein
MAKKTEKCPFAIGQCTATKDEDCRKKRQKRHMTGICFKIPVEREKNVNQ